MTRGLDVFKLKIIAFAGTVMLLAAWSGIIPSNMLWLRIVLGFIGASSIPLVSLILNEAVKNTSSMTLYMVRLIVLSALCAFPYFTLFHEPGGVFKFSDYLSGPFAVFYIAGVLLIYDKAPYKWLKTGILLLFTVISVFLGVEYAPVSVIIAFIIHCYDGPEKKKFRNFNLILFSAAMLAAGGALYIFGGRSVAGASLLTLITLSGAALAVPLLNLYNGNNNSFESKAGRFFAKYSFYLAYFVAVGGFALLKYQIVKFYL